MFIFTRNRLQAIQCRSRIFIRGLENECVLIALHVDDFGIAGSQAAINFFKSQFKVKFSIKELGPVKRIVGLQVEQDFFGINISQSAYIEDVVREFPEVDHMTPIPITDRDFKDIVSAIINGIDSPSVDGTLYKRIIDKLMYAMVAT